MDDQNAQHGKHLPFNSGLPTKPDVDLLLRTWPNPAVGDQFPYEAITALIRAEWQTARFRTVTTAWRSRLLERQVVVESYPGSHFYVASTDQITACTHGTLRFVGRKAHKHRRKLAAAKIETEQQRTAVELHARLMHAVERDTKKHRMNLIPDTATKEQVPRLPGKVA